jgi:hypothetical protein
MISGRFVLSLGFIAVCVAPCTAQTSKHDPKALAVLDQCAAAIKSLKALHEKVTITSAAERPDTLTSPAKKVIEIKFQRPNKLWLTLDEAGGGRTRIISDGHTLWRWSSKTNSYYRIRAPKELVEIEDLPDLTPDLAVLFGKITDFKLWPGPDVQMKPVPPPKTGDNGLDTLEGDLHSPGVNIGAKVTLTLNRTDHLIRSVVFASMSTDLAQNKPYSFKMEMNYEVVNASPMLSAADFRFTPPIGARIEIQTPAAKDSTK